MAAFLAVVVVGPTLPDNCAVTNEGRRKAAKAERSVSFILMEENRNLEGKN
jgi:hypothetical protein